MKPAGNNPLSSHRADQVVENIADLLAQGETIETILPRLGVTVDYVEALYRRRGLPNPTAKWHKDKGDAA